jgi:hypothetical protein
MIGTTLGHDTIVAKLNRFEPSHHWLPRTLDPNQTVGLSVRVHNDQQARARCIYIAQAVR